MHQFAELLLRFKSAQSSLAAERSGHPYESFKEIPQTCYGCRNYFGLVFGGVQTVCAVHPYGVEDDYCNDWESQYAKEEE